MMTAPRFAGVPGCGKDLRSLQILPTPGREGEAVMTTFSKLIIVALPGLWADPDPAALVHQLGAPRFAEREAAAVALREQGTVALPALRAAKDDKDPEVRARASELVDKIESEMMVKPTLVRLNFEQKTLADVVKSLSEQSHIPLSLQPENPLWHQKTITLKETHPVAFWEAVDRFCQVAGLSISPVVSMPGQPGRPAGLSFMAGAGWSPGHKCDSGPFRIHITSINYQKSYNLAQQGVFAGAMPGQQPLGIGSLPANEEFSFQLQVAAEPRLMVSQRGQLQLTEAVDDKGNSLLPAPTTANLMARNGSYNGFGVSFGTQTFQLRGNLKRPESPGGKIKWLKGKIPVTVSARKDDPLEITLADAKEKQYRSGNVGITIHDVAIDDRTQHPTIDVSLRLLSGEPSGANGMQPLNLPATQIDIADAQGRLYHQWYPATQTVSATEARMKLTLAVHEGLGRPAKLRYYELAHATTEAVFEYHDLPLP
jgi:hypothetical protein